MGIKASLSLPFAKFIVSKNNKWKNNAVKVQEKLMVDLINKAKHTQFGKDHNFSEIKNYSDFKQQIPVRDYEELKGYVQQIIDGDEDVLWPGKPLYFCKTSGTTSGTKYIPISKESMPHHITAARDAILSYIAETKNTSIVNGKMIFLQGSPELTKTGDILTGRLSGIVAHHIPAYLTKNRLPSFETNCIDDWETKVDAIVEETLPENMSLISGIPPWVQMYFEKLQSKTGKLIKDIFPKFDLFIYGGVNYEPYRKSFEKLIGKKVDGVELYPASEGFIAYQDSQKEEGMLLCVNHGIFYEFIPSDEFFNENPTRISLADVKVGVNYVIILNTDAGLWGYNIGDTIKFVSVDPYRIIVSGRIKHFTSAFGEHVIAEEVEKSLEKTIEKHTAQVNEFHVAPEVNPENGLPYHEWLIEFEKQPKDLEFFSKMLDDELQNLNTYYKDLISGGILKPLQVTIIGKNGFRDYMKSIGKLGGQNKVPRLANDRKVADKLNAF
ncbi:MAG: GH3 auxin-responsive promoter family protein [Flavobacteriales bacterium]|nr:GH3 auxin-responsive promoter family protein [Flavobacteriales bacterium]